MFHLVGAVSVGLLATASAGWIAFIASENEMDLCIALFHNILSNLGKCSASGTAM